MSHKLYQPVYEDINGNATVNNNLTVSNDLICDKLKNSSDSVIYESTNSSINVNVNNLNVTNNLIVNNLNNTEGDIEINNSNNKVDIRNIVINGNLNVNNNLHVNDISANKDFTVNGNIESNDGTINISNASVTGSFTVDGEIIFKNETFPAESTTNITTMSNLTSIGDDSKTTHIFGNLIVNGDIINYSGQNPCELDSTIICRNGATFNCNTEIGITTADCRFEVSGLSLTSNINGALLMTDGYGVRINGPLEVTSGLTLLQGTSYRSTTYGYRMFKYSSSISSITSVGGVTNADFTLEVHNKSWFEQMIHITSDERIKENITEIDDGSSLQKVRDISCVFYNYRDRISRGGGKVLGFIAQQVKEHFDIAVTTQKKIIPNELRELNITWDSSYNMTSDLQDVSGIKYKFYVSNDIRGNDECEKLVVGNADGTFTFDQSWNYVFCYGKEVDDFHVLDKQKLFALNFSATQEIDRNQQKQLNNISGNNIKIENNKSELELLKLKINELKKENTSLKTNIEYINNRLSQLEK